MTSSTSLEIDYISEAEKALIYQFTYHFGGIIDDLVFAMNNQNYPDREKIKYPDFQREIRIFLPLIADINIENFFAFLKEFYELNRPEYVDITKLQDIQFIASLLTYMIYEFGMHVFGAEAFFESVPKKLISLEAKVRIASFGKNSRVPQSVNSLLSLNEEHL